MFKFPPSILTNHVAILGKSGSGKTSTGKLLIEQVVAEKHRVCILDPIKSDYWGLTANKTGKAAGLPFRILGGPKQNVALPPESGAAIGRVVASGQLPLSIIDMAEFQMGDASHFFADFAQALLQRMTGVLYLVIDEAHEFAPKERSGIGRENQAIYWAKKLATAGRSKGIRLVVLSQRTQKLHNDLLGSCETVVAHRLIAPADKKPVGDWIASQLDPKQAAAVTTSLSRLRTGSAYICTADGSELVDLPKFATFDNTKTPELGDTAADAVARPLFDAAELADLIGDAVKEAAANDPKKLRQRIAELEHSVCMAATALPPHDAAYVEGLRNELAAMRIARDKAIAERDAAYSDLRRIRDAVAVQTIAIHGEPVLSEPKSEPPTVERESKAAGKPPKGIAAIVSAAIEMPGVTRDELTVLIGLKASSRNEYIRLAVADGLIEWEGDGLKATAKGRATVKAQPLPRGKALQDYYLTGDKLAKGEREILALAIRHYPNAISREFIGDKVELKASSRNEYIRLLTRRRLLTADKKGVRASSTLF